MAPSVAASRRAAPSPPRPPRPAAPPLDLVVAGCGVVGRAFLRAAAASVAAGAIRIVAVADRSGTLHDPAGLDPVAVATAKETASLRGIGRLLPFDGVAAARFVSADAILDLVPGSAGASDPESFPCGAALAAGRDAVTANKAPLALFPSAVAALRLRSRGRLLASATVGGGVPLLELLEGAFRGTGILEVAGAWNATSNAVLAAVEEGSDFSGALAAARARGYAEADATADLDGRDSAAKASIVAAAAFGLHLPLAEVERRGVADLDPEALRAAGRRGRRTRLVARVTPSGARVGPEVLPEDHPLAAAPGEAAVSIRTSAGTFSLRGPGAGGPATAAAVLHDALVLAADRSLRSAVPLVA